MSPEVTALAEAFAVAIHEAVRLELLEEMRAFAGQRQKREPRRAPPARRKKRRVKRSGGEAQLPRKKAVGRGGRAARDTSTGEVNPAVPGESPGPSSFKMEDLDTSRLLATARTERAPELWSRAPHLSKDGHTRGCRRKTSGKCSPNCVPTAASIEAAKQEELEDDEGAGAPQEDGLRAVSSDVAPAPGESAPIDPGSRLAEVTAAVMAEDVARREPAPMRRTRRYAPGEIAARGWRVVVIRIDGKPPRVALLTATPKEGFHDVQLSQGGNFRFTGRSHRILAVELIRDATEREAARGYVV